jgi:hypothetical protein
MVKRTNPTRLPTGREYLIMALVTLGVIAAVFGVNLIVGPN